MGYSYIPADIIGLRLEYSNPTDIVIKAGECLSDNERDRNRIVIESDLKVICKEKMDDGMALQSNTWYYVYVIYNPFLKRTDICITRTYGNPATTYSRKRFIGLFNTNIFNAQIQPFFYRGDDHKREFRYLIYTYHSIIWKGSATTRTAVNYSSYVPAIAQSVFVAGFNFRIDATASYVYVYNFDSSDRMNDMLYTGVGKELSMPVNGTRQLWYNVSAGGLFTAYISGFTFRV